MLFSSNYSLQQTTENYKQLDDAQGQSLDSHEPNLGHVLADTTYCIVLDWE